MPLSIYIIHYTKLTERKVMQCQQLKMFKGNVHFITKFDPEVISNSQYVGQSFFLLQLERLFQHTTVKLLFDI